MCSGSPTEQTGGVQSEEGATQGFYLYSGYLWAFASQTRARSSRLQQAAIDIIQHLLSLGHHEQAALVSGDACDAARLQQASAVVTGIYSALAITNRLPLLVLKTLKSSSQ